LGVETRTLEGAGFIENVTDCELNTNELHTISKLHGATRFNMETPLVYAPLGVSIINSHELPDVKAALTSGISKLERIKYRIQASRKTLKVDKLMHVANMLQPQTITSHWPKTTAATLGYLLTVVLVYLVIRKVQKCSVNRRPSQQPELRDAVPLQEIAVNNRSAEPQCESTVYTYAMPR
jgi:hypothetical protein